MRINLEIMLTERTEDYLEAIYNVHMKKGYIRVKDLACELGVKCPSVTEMLKKLKSLQFITYEKYGGILLTEKGSLVARAVKDRHDTLVSLLTLAGVPNDIANKDACVMEHHLSPISLERLKLLVSDIESKRAHKLVECHI
jgi:DtxR family transcriptional regulator, Mn-dependent transcriptional regulator